MKKIVSIALIVIFTVSAFAQQQRKQKRHDFTVEQIAELKTKKMTLQLDLTEVQQKQVFEINKKQAVVRKEKMAARKAAKESDIKPTSNEIFAKKNENLDKMITHKAEMKKILTEEQFEKWQKMRKNKARKMKGKSAKRKGQQKKRNRK